MHLDKRKSACMIASACKSSKVKCNVIKLPGSQKNAGAIASICSLERPQDKNQSSALPILLLTRKPPSSAGAHKTVLFKLAGMA